MPNVPFSILDASRVLRLWSKGIDALAACLFVSLARSSDSDGGGNRCVCVSPAVVTLDSVHELALAAVVDAACHQGESAIVLIVLPQLICESIGRTVAADASLSGVDCHVLPDTRAIRRLRLTNNPHKALVVSDTAIGNAVPPFLESMGVQSPTFVLSFHSCRPELIVSVDWVSSLPSSPAEHLACALGTPSCATDVVEHARAIAEVSEDAWFASELLEKCGAAAHDIEMRTRAEDDADIDFETREDGVMNTAITGHAFVEAVQEFAENSALMDVAVMFAVASEVCGNDGMMLEKLRRSSEKHAFLGRLYETMRKLGGGDESAAVQPVDGKGSKFGVLVHTTRTDAKQGKCSAVYFWSKSTAKEFERDMQSEIHRDSVLTLTNANLKDSMHLLKGRHVYCPFGIFDKHPDASHICAVLRLHLLLKAARRQPEPPFALHVLPGRINAALVVSQLALLCDDENPQGQAQSPRVETPRGKATIITATREGEINLGVL